MKEKVDVGSDEWITSDGHRVGFVYRLRLSTTNKIYIGSTNDLYKRYKQHLYCLKNHKHSSKSLQNDYDKYGGEILLDVLEVARNYRECEFYWQIKLKSYVPESGYNLTDLGIMCHVKKEPTTKLKSLIGNEGQLPELLGLKEEEERILPFKNYYLYSIEVSRDSMRRRTYKYVKFWNRWKRK